MVSKTKKTIKKSTVKIKPNVKKQVKTVEKKQEKKIKKTNKVDNTMPWKIMTGILAVLFIAVIVMPYTGNNDSNVLGETEAKELVENFIPTIQPGLSVVVDTISEINGLYELNITISANGQDQKMVSYMTLDGKTLFPQGMEIVEGEAIAAQPQATAAPTEYIKADKPTLEVYTMSFCPYGQLANKLTAPVVNILSDVANIIPRWVIYGTDYYKGQEDVYCIGDFCSMHGLYEVEEDVRQMCVWENNPDKYWDYVLDIAENCNKANLDTCWKSAAESVGVDVATIETCFSEDALTLLAAEKAIADENGIQGSEALLLNGAKLSMSDYRWSSEKLKTLICDSFNDAPEICGQTIEESEAASIATTGSC
ncbi:hypothetical protein GQ473_06285 [archaeon]|nr:hypothetical protein [archaeon]